MRLLVSVRSAEEVEAALSGGADIIDAKEPAAGSLGAVSSQTLRRILDRVPTTHPFSAALGDVHTVEDVIASISAAELPARAAPVFLKLGFAGVRSPNQIRVLLSTAVQIASARQPILGIVAVSYADNARAESVSPEIMSELARDAGAAGVLIDTYMKDGAGLFHWWDTAALCRWVSTTRTLGLQTAAAGSLVAGDILAVASAAPDIVGFRGAACDTGRTGRVSAARVRLLHSQVGLVEANSSVQPI